MIQTSTQVTEQAQAWRDKNPDMWRAFCARAIDASANHEQWSARGIAEALRWDPTYQRTFAAQFKIPNSITPILGRMVVEEYPYTEPWFRRAHSKVDA